MAITANVNMGQYDVMNKTIFNRNYKLGWSQAVQQKSFDGPLQSFYEMCQSEIQDGHHNMTKV